MSRRKHIPLNQWWPSSDTCMCRYSMMTSSNGNIFRVTGHLCGEFTGDFDLRLNKQLSKQSWGWRRYRAHYDVTVMRQSVVVDINIYLIVKLKWSMMEYLKFCTAFVLSAMSVIGLPPRVDAACRCHKGFSHGQCGIQIRLWHRQANHVAFIRETKIYHIHTFL